MKSFLTIVTILITLKILMARVKMKKRQIYRASTIDKDKCISLSLAFGLDGPIRSLDP